MDYDLDMKPTLIYAIKDTTTHEVRYVGKTVNPYGRFKKHLSSSNPSSSYTYNWILSIDHKVEFIHLEWVEEDWQDAERFWIAYFKSLGARLTNLTSGGEGMCDPPQEYRDKVSARSKGNQHAKGYKHTFEALQKIADANRGQRKALGHRHDEATKKIISEAGLGRTKSPETLAKMKESHARLSDKKSADMLRVWEERKANWVSKYDDKNIILDYLSGVIENKDLLKKYGIGSSSTLYKILSRNNIPLKGAKP